MEKGLIYSEQGSLFGRPEIVGYSNGVLYVRVIDRHKANAMIIKNHYSHKVTNSTFIHLGVYDNGDNLVGCLQYGSAMNPASCSSVVAGTEQNRYLELNRMWLDDCAGRNSESMAISCSITYIRHAYPTVKWIQSFADERCNCYGIVYQACSFDYYGEHTSEFWELDGVVYHNISMTVLPTHQRYINNVGGTRYLQENRERATKLILRQFRYIKWLDKSWANRCLLQKFPYPKHYLANEIQSKMKKLPLPKTAGGVNITHNQRIIKGCVSVKNAKSRCRKNLI